MRDRAGHVFKFATCTIGAHSYVKIHTGKGKRSQADRYWGLSWYVWNNDGDTARLRDNHGNLIDHCAYRDHERKSWLQDLLSPRRPPQTRRPLGPKGGPGVSRFSGRAVAPAQVTAR